MAVVALDKLTKIYDRGQLPAADAVSLEVRHGEFMVLLGPSGCGKTTTLRMIAGLESISSGELAIDGRVVNDVPAKDRDIAMVFQSYALYPHMTVRDNLGLGLRARRVWGTRGGASPGAQRVFWCGEPLSTLDASLRVSTRGELIKLHRRLGAT